MKILVTGNNGYIGTVLTEKLLSLGYEVVGLDNNYFKKCNFLKTKLKYLQIFKDIRNIEIDDVKNIDAIIHLAALSNDPLGELNPNLTDDINYKATIKLAKIAKKNEVKRFVYASTQSVYGISQSSKELSEDYSSIMPLTSYAKSKWKSEIELKKLCSDDFTITIFRPSTVYGVSSRLRCDIVFNNFLACAFTSGKIEVLSDGKPWRPVVHVRDVCDAFIAGLTAPKEIVKNNVFNVGTKEGNFTVKNLALIVQNLVKGSELVFLNEHNDPRTYKVSFKKIFDKLSNYYKPQWNLNSGAEEMIEFFKHTNFNENDFRGNKCNRLRKLKYLISKKIISNNLEWIKND